MRIAWVIEFMKLGRSAVAYPGHPEKD